MPTPGIMKSCGCEYDLTSSTPDSTEFSHPVSAREALLHPRSLKGFLRLISFIFVRPAAFLRILFVAIRAIVRAIGGFRRGGIDMMILLVARNAPAHCNWLDLLSNSHAFHISVAKAAHLLNRAPLLKIKSLNVPLVIKAHEIWEIVHL